MPIRTVAGSDAEMRAERARRQRAARPAAGDDFARHLHADAASTADQPAAVTTSAWLAPLLDAQEIGPIPAPELEQQGKRAAARDHASGLLDRLDELRLDLLGGRLSRARLQQLSRQLENGGEPSGDTRLDALVEAIQTRLEVELAKYSRR